RRHHPRCCQYGWVLYRSLPNQIFPVLPETLDHTHLGAMQISVLAEPGILHEVPDIDNEYIALPLSNRVSVMRRVCIHAMRTAIGRNDAIRITGNIFIEKNRLSRQLNDLSRRTNARYTGLSTIEHRV